MWWSIESRVSRPLPSSSSPSTFQRPGPTAAPTGALVRPPPLRPTGVAQLCSRALRSSALLHALPCSRLPFALLYASIRRHVRRPSHFVRSSLLVLADVPFRAFPLPRPPLPLSLPSPIAPRDLSAPLLPSILGLVSLWWCGHAKDILHSHYPCCHCPLRPSDERLDPRRVDVEHA